MAKESESELHSEQNYRVAMQTLIGARFGAVWKAVPVAIEGTDPEGVHDVRVASRRLRAAMDVAVGCFPESWYVQLHNTAKAITTELGEVRDRDVLIEYLGAERDRVSPQERVGLNRLIDRVSREREVAREHMLAFLAALGRDGIATEAERRFGSAAKAPWSQTQENRS